MTLRLEMAHLRLSRRRLCAGLLGLGAAASLHASEVRAAPAGARVIVDNDLAGDPDGLLALAYQLVSPAVETMLVTTTALDPTIVRLAGGLPAGRTAARGAELGREVVVRSGVRRPPPVAAGAETFGAGPGQITPAAHAIVAEDARSDTRALYLTCGGPLTNVSAALRLNPSVARKLVLVWIGGGEAAEDAQEYNFRTDPAAARHVLRESDVPLWRVPLQAYSTLELPYAQIRSDLRPTSPLTAWLSERLTDLPSFVRPTPLKGIGDVATVPLVASAGAWGLRLDQRVGPRIARVYPTLPADTVAAALLTAFRQAADRAATA